MSDQFSQPESDEDFALGDEEIQEMAEELSDDEENSRKELLRMRDLKSSQRKYMDHIKASGKKGKNTAIETDVLELKMKELIFQAERLASFLLSKHRMNSADPRNERSLKRRNTVTKEEDDQEAERELHELEDDEAQEFIRLDRQPSILKGGQLKDYQMIGLNWLISLYEIGINGILADQMGLGKTIQTIAFLAFLKEFKKIPGPHLIVGPNSTVGNWCKEIKKWAPCFRVVKLYARKEHREEIFQNKMINGKFDICVTSYEGINICLPKLKKFNWRYIIIDEAHRLKNDLSVLSQNLRMFKTDLKILITGTPLQNNLHELWALLNFLLPDLFDDAEIFDSTFALSQVDDTKDTKEVEKKNVEIINSLHRILRPFLLRRTKDDMAKSLPPKKEIQLYIGLTETQVDIYKRILTNKSIGGLDKKFYMNVLMQLRKVCNHPYLFEGVEDPNAPTYGDHIIEHSGKMIVLDKLLTKLYVFNKFYRSRVVIKS